MHPRKTEWYQKVTCFFPGRTPHVANWQYLLWLHVLLSQLKESFLGLQKQSHWNDCQVEPFCFSLWGYFYTQPEKICPWSFINYLWKLLCMSKDASREALHKFCSRETLLGQKAPVNSFGWLQGLHQGLFWRHPGRRHTLGLQGCAGPYSCSASHTPPSAPA